MDLRVELLKKFIENCDYKKVVSDIYLCMMKKDNKDQKSANNLFRILGLNEDLKTRDEMFFFLLNPYESHNSGTLFLKKYLEYVFKSKDEIVLTDISYFRDFYLDSPFKKDSTKVDCLIKAEDKNKAKYLITISDYNINKKDRNSDYKKVKELAKEKFQDYKKVNLIIDDNFLKKARTLEYIPPFLIIWEEVSRILSQSIYEYSEMNKEMFGLIRDYICLLETSSPTQVFGGPFYSLTCEIKKVLDTLDAVLKGEEKEEEVVNEYLKFYNDEKFFLEHIMKNYNKNYFYFKR